MSDTKFTPGPWMQKKHDGAGGTFELKREFWEVGGGPDKAGVAFVFKGQANANLIAAAPDMYEALKWCAEALKQAEAKIWPEASDEMRMFTARRNAIAILAKADGRQA